MTLKTHHTPEPMQTRKRDVLDKWATQARHRTRPTRESWMADLLSLGSVDTATARELTRGGRPQWPWIPPFELDQVEELTARSCREAADLLRRAAKADLEPHRPKLAETSTPTRPSREHPTNRPVRSAMPASPSTRPYSATRNRRSNRPPLSRLPRLATALGVAGLLTLIAWLAIRSIESTEPSDPQDIQPKPAVATRELRESEALDQAVARLIHVLERTAETRADFEPRKLILADIPALATLGPADQRRRPEVARIVLALAIRRSGLSYEGLAREAVLFRAVVCGWLGPIPPSHDPACDARPPLAAIDGLIRDLESGGPDS